MYLEYSHHLRSSKVMYHCCLIEWLFWINQVFLIRNRDYLESRHADFQIKSLDYHIVVLDILLNINLKWSCKVVLTNCFRLYFVVVDLSSQQLMI